MKTMRNIIASTKQIRELDRKAIEEFGLPGLVLMENAGRGATRIALEMLTSPGSQTALVLCGKGNNGGDGFVVARHLHNALVAIETFLTAQVDDVDPESDAGINLHVVRKMGIPIRPVLLPEEAADLGERLRKADLIIDALLGTGLSGGVREPARTLIETINASGRPVLAIDTPSGLCTDTGRVLGVAVSARRTATFAAAKRGFYKAEGPERVGRLDVVDIGVPRALLEAIA